MRTPFGPIQTSFSDIELPEFLMAVILGAIGTTFGFLLGVILDLPQAIQSLSAGALGAMVMGLAIRYLMGLPPKAS